MSEKRPTYIQMMSPNQEELVAMLSKAKGSTRGWAEYAKDCGINPSTMSRIINGKLKSPLSIKSLEKLYKHRVDTCKVTFDQFILASGMIDCNKQRSMVDKHIAQREKIDKTGDLIERSIVNGLYERSIQFTRLDHVDENLPDDEEIISLFGKIHCSQLLKVGEGEGEDKHIVGFEYVPLKIDEDDDDPEKTIRFIVRLAVENYATIFLQDAWFKDNWFIDRVTFVFADPRLFDAFVASFAKRHLNHYMTVLLVDTESTCVVDEKPLGDQDGKNFVSLFDSPITERSGRRFGEQINIFGNE